MGGKNLLLGELKGFMNRSYVSSPPGVQLAFRAADSRACEKASGAETAHQHGTGQKDLAPLQASHVTLLDGVQPT